MSVEKFNDGDSVLAIYFAEGNLVKGDLYDEIIVSLEHGAIWFNCMIKGGLKVKFNSAFIEAVKID